MMRVRIRWLWLIAGLLLAPQALRAQSDVPPVLFTGPLSHPRYDEGGLYTTFEGVWMRTNRPLRQQQVAIRGFMSLDNTFGTPPTFIGSQEEALNVDQVRGPGSHQPGWDLRLGWRFNNGVVVELGWMHLVQAKYHAAAGLVSPTFNVGFTGENTFLFSPVTNFPAQWAGNDQNFPQGFVGTTFGIWNAASIMQIEYTQRFDTYDVRARLPIWNTADYRSYGLFGPRIAWIWDRFSWRTVDADQNGIAGPDTTAIYDNMISNRMWGVHCGIGHDCWLGNTPIGGFAFTFEAEAGLYLNFVKTHAAYTLADRSISSGRNRRFSTLVPSAEGRIAFWWYPWEGIQLSVGYDVMAYFNTISSRRPIDFNLGTVDPEYNHEFVRHFNGLRFGITFVW